MDTFSSMIRLIFEFALLYWGSTKLKRIHWNCYWEILQVYQQADQLFDYTIRVDSLLVLPRCHTGHLDGFVSFLQIWDSRRRFVGRPGFKNICALQMRVTKNNLQRGLCLMCVCMYTVKHQNDGHRKLECIGIMEELTIFKKCSFTVPFH